MKELYYLLKSPFEGLRQDEVAGIQNRCFKIAKTLFENYSVACGDKVYRFAEIEFYYYKKEELGKNNFDKDWNRETYPRNKDAGDFFFHYSGVDICFQCHYDDVDKDNEYGEFGGILIRSLLDGEKILAGPLFCANMMLNACKGIMPALKKENSQKYELKSATRFGISSDKNQEKGKELFLCYYATDVKDKKLNWDTTSERIAWKKKSGVFKKQTRNYRKDRFNDNH